MKNCIKPPYKKLKSLESGFIKNSNFENNRDPCDILAEMEIVSWGMNAIKEAVKNFLADFSAKEVPPLPPLPP